MFIVSPIMSCPVMHVNYVLMYAMSYVMYVMYMYVYVYV